MAVPPIIEPPEFEAVQALLKSRSPALTAPRITSGPTLLTGICFCAGCGRAMTLRTGKSGRYRYYTCSTKARQGEPCSRASRYAYPKNMLLRNLGLGHGAMDAGGGYGVDFHLDLGASKYL